MTISPHLLVPGMSLRYITCYLPICYAKTKKWVEADPISRRFTYYAWAVDLILAFETLPSLEDVFKHFQCIFGPLSALQVTFEVSVTTTLIALSGHGRNRGHICFSKGFGCMDVVDLGQMMVSLFLSNDTVISLNTITVLNIDFGLSMDNLFLLGPMLLVILDLFLTVRGDTSMLILFVQRLSIFVWRE